MKSNRILKLASHFERLASEQDDEEEKFEFGGPDPEEELEFGKELTRPSMFEDFEGFENEEEADFDPGEAWKEEGDYNSSSIVRNMEEVANIAGAAKGIIEDSKYDDHDYRSGLEAILATLNGLKKTLWVGFGGKKSDTLAATGIGKKLDDLISSIQNIIGL